MKINIMGAGGRLGRKVVRALASQGVPYEDMVLSVRAPSRLENLADQGAAVRRADYDDPGSMVGAFKGSDILLLIPTFADVEARVTQHGAAVDAAKAVGVKRLLLSGFAAATPQSKFVIAPFMLYAESRIRVSGMDWTLLRNGMYLDPIADWMPELVETGRLPYPVKDAAVAYVARDDLARATAAACIQDGHVGKLYNLTGEAALSMPDLAAIVSRVTGSSVRFDSVSDEEFANVCRTGKEEVSKKMIETLTSLYHAVNNREFENVTHHVEYLTGKPAESAASYLARSLASKT